MRFTGDDERDLDWEYIKGLVMSNALVEGLDFKAAPGREEHLVGEPRAILFIDDSNEGVKGVFASERARAREGVLGWLCMIHVLVLYRQSEQVKGKEQTKNNNAFPTRVM